MSDRMLRPVRASRRRAWRAAAVVLGLLFAFAIGIALGESLDDNTPSGGTQSIVRTLNPLPLAPAQQTVTVTVTTP